MVLESGVTAYHFNACSGYLTDTVWIKVIPNTSYILRVWRVIESTDKNYLVVETMVFKIAHVRLQEKCGKKEIHGKL